MDRVIFLDIDGVLNCVQTFKQDHIIRKLYRKYLEDTIDNRLKCLLLEIDFYKLQLLKQIVNNTGCKIVITSSWKNLRIYPLVEEYLINKGIPIIGTTSKINVQRGLEIKKYISDNNIQNFVVIDDEVFPDYDEFILENFIHTDFYQGGLQEENVGEITKILTHKNSNML